MTKIPSDSLTPNNFRSTAHQMSALTTGPWLHPFIEAAAVQINNTNLPPGNTSTCIMNDAINQWRSYVYRRARCSFVVECSLNVQWVVSWIPHGGLIELFLIPASASHLVYQRLCYVLSCLWDGAYKEILEANGKKYSMWWQWVSERVAQMAAAGFLSLSEWSFTICLMPYNHR